MRHRASTRGLAPALALSGLAAAAAWAQPTVVPTAEGQVGVAPGMGDQVLGARFESIRGAAGDILLGGLFDPGGGSAPPPEFGFATDRFHVTPMPQEKKDVSSPFAEVFKNPPASARSRNAANSGDFAVFAFAVDGSAADTQTVNLWTFDESGTNLSMASLADVPTFMFPDAFLNDVGVVIDEQGRATVVFTEVSGGPPAPRPMAARFDGSTGTAIDAAFPLLSSGAADPDAALLDPPGAEVAVAVVDFGTGEIKGQTIDFSGATPTVKPGFPVSTTPAFFNLNPTIAADPTTGTFTVVWEHFLTGSPAANPVDIRARRFDAMGNPVGNDFVVNTTTANAQGQPAVAMGPGGETVVVWAGDAANTIDKLDVFAQAYDAAGNPIGGEIRVNTTTAERQDRPTVRFLPENDAQGRPQFAVLWRDVDDTDQPTGTGVSYKCFAIDGLGPPPVPIFEDGFESGDTASWSSKQP